MKTEKPCIHPSHLADGLKIVECGHVTTSGTALNLRQCWAPPTCRLCGRNGSELSEPCPVATELQRAASASGATVVEFRAALAALGVSDK